MRVKNTTPYLFGTTVTSRRPPQPEMTAIVRGTFALAPGGVATPLTMPLPKPASLTGDVFLDDDDGLRGACLYPSDFADFKPTADVLLRGTCHTPGGEPLPECPVRFSVGAFSKTLLVVGPRVWRVGAFSDHPSDPVPFTRMPLGYDHAFGGPDDDHNPVGKGHGTGELPNVETPGHGVRTRRDRPHPAGFGPLSPSWPERRARVGKDYGASYAKHRAPFYAEDFDWTYFNAAPADQRLPGYLDGDEALVLHNLHPEHVSYACRLPGVRPRVFVDDRAGRAREIALHLDTLFVDMDQEIVLLTWRGLTPVDDLDLRDVTTVLVAEEKLGEARPEALYREQMAAFARDPLGLSDLSPTGFARAPAQPSPAPSPGPSRAASG